MSTPVSPTRSSAAIDLEPISPRTRIIDICSPPPEQERISAPPVEEMDHHEAKPMIPPPPPPQNQVSIHIDIPKTLVHLEDERQIDHVESRPRNFETLDSAQSPNYSLTQPHLFSPISSPPPVVSTEINDFIIDFFAPDPRPTFVVKLPPSADSTVTLGRPSVSTPISFNHATSFYTASVSTMDDIHSDLSGPSTQPSSLLDTFSPRASSLDDETDSKSPVNYGCEVVYCNPALEGLEFRQVDDVLQGRNTLGHARGFWQWVSGSYSQDSQVGSDLVTPNGPAVASFVSAETSVHFGITWTRHTVRRQWVVISAKHVPPLMLTPSTKVPPSLDMPISIEPVDLASVPLPVSPPVHKVRFEFSAGNSAATHSHTSSTTSIDTAELDEATILPHINTEIDTNVATTVSQPSCDDYSSNQPGSEPQVHAYGNPSPHDTPMDLDSTIDQLYEITSHQQVVDGISNDIPSTIHHNDLSQRLLGVAEIFPVGMCLSSPTGVVQFANSEWYRISGMSRTAGLMTTCIADEHHINVERAFDQLNSEDSVTFEFRTKGTAGPLIHGEVYDSENEDNISERIAQGERYMMATSTAERRPNGRVFRILTVLIDVTAQKRSAAAASRRAQEAENLKRMAENATVGMYHTDTSGRLFSANDVFFTMTGQERVDLQETEIRLWDLAYPDEENGSYEDRLKYVAASGRSWTNEVRLKTTWMADDGYGGRRPAPRWVVATMLPIRDHEGNVTSFTGCIADISNQKWQIERERQRKEEAIESKRQQENFIDMTSHEMRNPLGAIIQCADDIINSLTGFLEDPVVMAILTHSSFNDREGSIPESVEYMSTPMRDRLARSDCGSSPGPGINMSPRQSIAHATTASKDSDRRLRMIEDCMEDAETIVTCAQHQKRIVDDILTLSKLDAKLLMVTPVTVDPVDMVSKALKMFEAEARRVHVSLNFIIDTSFSNFSLPFLDFDPSRVTQVLINLLSNALKFTQGRPRRSIIVRLKASMNRPEAPFCSVPFIKRLSWKTAMPKGAGALANVMPEVLEETPDDALYLLFEVEDTGKGLSEEETRSLFSRFYQANSRTHVQHGGSGLGLFISRRLTELQNGAIGVKSKAGEGSTFAFYIQSTLPAAPAVDEAKSVAETLAAAQKERGSRKSSAADKGIKKPSIFQKLRARRAKNMKPSAAVGGLHYVMGNSNVLVVEDNSINARVTKKGLTEHGFNVDVVTNGIEAVDKLTAQSQVSSVSKTIGIALSEAVAASTGNPSHHLQLRPPVFTAFRSRRSSASTASAAPSHATSATSLSALSSSASSPPAGSIGMVLMDIEMPLQNGLDCTRQIRQLEREGKITCAMGGRLPIIAISGHARAEAVAKAREAGCDGVMVKPFRIPDLLETMKAVFKGMAESAVAEEEEEGRSKTERQHSV